MGEHNHNKAKSSSAKAGGGTLLKEKTTTSNAPVKCLGMEFENDDTRRAHFTELLRKKLQDPEFRKIEGFPIGKDEDILKLSDPPYYTACPNPWMADFIAEWESEKPAKPADYAYHRKPFAADVSEGKNDPIYNAHSYHTKVPHKAIMRYILHYTEPGDIVFDGFCGTGMTGVAAQMCGDRATVQSLGYRVDNEGVIYQLDEQESTENETRQSQKWVPFSRLGARKAVLNDLSPAATFIAYNYNTPVDVHAFEREANRILAEVEAECGWMYETLHTDGITKGKINYTVWSEVFACPDCTREIVFWEVAIDKNAGKVQDVFPCPYCQAQLTKRKMDKVWITRFDSALNDSIRQVKQVPVLINYSLYGIRGRFQKTPDEFDLHLINKFENSNNLYWFPTDKVMKGVKTSDPIRLGITNVHHFFTARAISILSSFAHKSRDAQIKNLWVATAVTEGSSKLNRERPFGLPSKLSGTLYVSSMIRETNVIEFLRRKILKYQSSEKRHSLIGCYSSTDIKIEGESLDYIFIDPPFGANLNYSELNLLWESWLRVITNNQPEAIENSVQGKGPTEYRQLMIACFIEAYRALKPGRWMTVEFSNTKASVWNNIQTALTQAGFIVANVSALDKKQGSFNAVTNPTSVKQDLVISAYKPNGGFERRFEQEARTEEGVWDFIRTHLKYLPVVKKQGKDIVAIPERDPRILYDQLIAYYVRKGHYVPIDSQEFQSGLPQRFAERDGMYFLSEQVVEYDRTKMISGGKMLQQPLFITNESSSIEWLRRLLRDKPQTTQDITPKFLQEISGWSRYEERLELSTLLAQNFLCYDGNHPVPEQIHRYLSSNWPTMRNLANDDSALIAKAKDRWYVPDPNNAIDLEKTREKALLRDFEKYRQSGKKLKIFRIEAVRTGFKVAWKERNYHIIIEVAEKIIPSAVLEEDSLLLRLYNMAATRIQGDKGSLI